MFTGEQRLFQIRKKQAKKHTDKKVKYMFEGEGELEE